MGSGVLPDLCILLCKIYVCMCVYSNQYNKRKEENEKNKEKEEERGKEKMRDAKIYIY